MNEKKYSLLNNVFFLLRMIRKYLPMSFVFVIIDIPLAVFMDYVGVRIPNLIVGMIQGYSVSVGMVAALGIASVLAAVTLQYGNRMVSAQAPQLCAKLDLKLFEKYMTCSYEKLEDADFTAHYKEADGYLADDNHFLSEAAMHIIEIGSGALGIILYFAILVGLPKWVLAVLIVGTVVELLISKNAETERKKRQETIGKLTRKVDYMNKTAADVRSAKDIRIFDMIPWLEKKFAEVMDRFHIENTQVEKQRIRIAGIRAGIGGILEILTGILLVVFVLQEKLSLAEYILYVGAIRSFSMWSFQFGTLVQNFYRMNGDLSRIRSFIDEEETTQSNVKPDTHSIASRRSNVLPVNAAEIKFDHISKIEFSHVFYRYPKSDRWIVKDLSFVIEEGEKIALVGMNGAGKTTMIKLLCGLLIPTRGTIRINGVSSTDIKREDYYRLFSTVFQDIHLFPASIQRNIVCRDDQIDQVRFEDAVKKSGMDEVAQKFRDGLNTLLVAEVDEEAVNLSGGQVQKLMLARAIYKNAPILLLDEPTAALDPIAEKDIYLQYNEMTEGKMSIFISHRLASTVFCDRIFFMKNGIISEEGTHEEPDTLALAKTYEGEIYALPKFQGKWPDCNGVMFINKTWLDNLGLDVPTTLGELKDVLVAFRDNDANGNGDASDEIPMDFNGWFSGAYSLTNLIGSYGIQLTNWGTDGYFVEDGQVKNYAVDERYKALISYLADLYSEGLINENAITNDYSMFQSLSRGDENGDALVGVVLGWEETDKFGPTLHDQYVPCGPFADDVDDLGTDEPRWTYDYSGLNMSSNRICMSASCANPEAAMKFMNEFYDSEVSVQVLFGGITDGCVEKTGDDSYKVLDPLDPNTDSGTWKWTSSMADNGPMYIRRATTIDMAQDMTYALEEREQYKEALARIDMDNEYYPQMLMKYTSDDQNAMAVTQANVTNVTDAYWGLWLTGQSNIEDDWDSYVEEVNAAGLQDILAIRQASYDSYKENSAE